ncbi:hypothetical protein BVL40_12395, partial [Corynebacterium diphtheriae]
DGHWDECENLRSIITHADLSTSTGRTVAMSTVPRRDHVDYIHDDGHWDECENLRSIITHADLSTSTGRTVAMSTV